MSMQLYSGLEFAGGTLLAEITPILPGSGGSIDVEHNDRLTIVTTWDAYWLTLANLRKVVRRVDELSRITEWRISTIGDGRRAGGDGTVTVTCVSVLQDLTAVGYLAALDGVDTTFNLGAELNTDEQFVRAFLLPRLTTLGYTHYTAGTFDFTQRRNRAWDRWTARQLLQGLADLSGGEIQHERDEVADKYDIGIVAALGSSLPTLHLRTDKEILSIDRTRSDELLATAVLAVGAVPDGDVDPATIAYNTWKVTAVSGSDLTLADPNMGDDPIVFADQLTGYYVRKPDGTRTEITVTNLATQQITVASASGIAVNDHISIVKNSAGEHLTMLTNPAAVTEFGTVVGTIEDGEARGERNFVVNPFGSDWSGTEYADYGLADGNQTSTTINLKGLKAGLVIAVGARLQTRVNNLSVFPTVQTGGTVSGGGTVSLVFTGSVTVTNDENVWIHSAFDPPDGWSPVVGGGVLLWHRVDTTNDVALSGLVNGAVTNSGGFVADGSTADAAINPGDILEFSGPTYHVVRGPVAIDGSGNARIPLGRIVTLSDNAAFTVFRPTWSADIGPYAMWIAPTIASNNHVDTPDVVITVDGSTPTVRCGAGFTIFSPSTDNTTSSQPIKPRLEIYDVGGAAVLETIDDEDDSFVALGEFHGNLRGSVTLDADATLRLRFYPIRMSSDSFGSSTTIDPHTYLRWFLISVATDELVPAGIGSFANQLWHLANVQLTDRSTLTYSMTATVAELARSNPDFADEAIGLGQQVEITAFDMAGAQTLVVTARIVTIEFFEDPAQSTKLTFATIPPRIARLLSQVRTKKLYVQIAGETAIASDKAPVAQQGALRARVPPGQTGTDDGITPPPINPYETGEEVGP